MKRVIRIVVWVLVLVVAIAGLAITSLYMLADPNKLKPALTQEVMKRTGYKVVLDGDLSWSIYPKIGVYSDKVTVTAPDKESPFLELGKVSFAVEPMQLLVGTRKLSGEVHVADAKLMNVRATGALVGLNWQDNTLILRPVQASMYDGSLSGVIRGKGFSSVPAWAWDLTLSHVQVGPLLKDMNTSDSEIKIEGRGQVKLKAATSGKSTQDMLNNLSGDLDFSLQNGVFHGVDINYFLAAADSFLTKSKVEMPDNVHQTNFDSLVGSALINNGIAQTNNLLLTSSRFKVQGQGTYNVPREKVDMELKVLTNNMSMRWEVPVLVRGDISSPDVRLDMSAINQMLAARELKEVKTKVKKQIEKKLPGKAGAYLQNLIGD